MSNITSENSAAYAEMMHKAKESTRSDHLVREAAISGVCAALAQAAHTNVIVATWLNDFRHNRQCNVFDVLCGCIRSLVEQNKTLQDKLIEYAQREPLICGVVATATPLGEIRKADNKVIGDAVRLRNQQNADGSCLRCGFSVRAAGSELCLMCKKTDEARAVAATGKVPVIGVMQIRFPVGNKEAHVNAIKEIEQYGGTSDLWGQAASRCKCSSLINGHDPGCPEAKETP